MSLERVAIVGTAQSWSMTPWTDPGLTICSLNDAYRLNGFVRADAWYDFHPLDKFYTAPAGQLVYAHQIPPGYYVRPAGHLEWLGQQTIPVYLHPDYATQHPPSATWAHARPFPKADVEAAFGRYFTSSPQWMIAHALLHGAKEIQVYGIHLATESEYLEQRPGFEYLLGRVLGPSKVTVTVKNGLRHYETRDGHVVLPEASPILQSDFQYAFQPRPRAVLEPLKWELHKVAIKQQRILHAMKTKAPWAPWVTLQEPAADPQQPPIVRRLSTRAAQQEWWRLDAWSADCQDRLQRAQATWS